MCKCMYTVTDKTNCPARLEQQSIQVQAYMTLSEQGSLRVWQIKSLKIYKTCCLGTPWMTLHACTSKVYTVAKPSGYLCTGCEANHEP